MNKEWLSLADTEQLLATTKAVEGGWNAQINSIDHGAKRKMGKSKPLTKGGFQNLYIIPTGKIQNTYRPFSNNNLIRPYQNTTGLFKILADLIKPYQNRKYPLTSKTPTKSTFPVEVFLSYYGDLERCVSK